MQLGSTTQGHYARAPSSLENSKVSRENKRVQVPVAWSEIGIVFTGSHLMQAKARTSVFGRFPRQAPFKHCEAGLGETSRGRALRWESTTARAHDEDQGDEFEVVDDVDKSHSKG